MKKFSDYLEMIQESEVTNKSEWKIYESFEDLKNKGNYTNIRGTYSIRFYGKQNNEVKIYQFER